MSICYFESSSFTIYLTIESPIAAITITETNSAKNNIPMKNKKHRNLKSINNYFTTDLLAVNTKITNKIYIRPIIINTTSIIVNVLNYLQSHMERATNTIAVKPKIRLTTLIKKNKLGLPGFIFYLYCCILSCI